MSQFIELTKKRHSVYGIGKQLPIRDDALQAIVKEAVLHTPSAFNSQTSRVVLLVKEDHDKFWNIVLQVLKTVVKADRFATTQEKIAGFKDGYGTVLFFEEQDTIHDLQARFPLYKEQFPIWSLQSSGMLQFVVWTALANENIGASLQHYNPLIDDQVKQAFNLPSSWKLHAEMPFGNIINKAEAKDKMPIEKRIKVFGL